MLQFTSTNEHSDNPILSSLVSLLKSNSNVAISLVLNSEYHHKLQTSRYEIIVLFEIQRGLIGRSGHTFGRTEVINSKFDRAYKQWSYKGGNLQTGGNFSYKRSK